MFSPTQPTSQRPAILPRDWCSSVLPWAMCLAQRLAIRLRQTFRFSRTRSRLTRCPLVALNEAEAYAAAGLAGVAACAGVSHTETLSAIAASSTVTGRTAEDMTLQTGW